MDQGQHLAARLRLPHDFQVLDLFERPADARKDQPMIVRKQNLDRHSFVCLPPRNWTPFAASQLRPHSFNLRRGTETMGLTALLSGRPGLPEEPSGPAWKLPLIKLFGSGGGPTREAPAPARAA